MILNSICKKLIVYDSMYKISIIVPVYNAEKFLERAINSIINQTFGFENIELIMVDDCSSDKSRQIIEKYSNRYSNIVAIYSKENHGFPGYGRNVGIEKASAKYIMFLDNDDEYSPDYCEVMYNAIESEGVDVVCSNHTIKYAYESVKRNTMLFVAQDLSSNENPLKADLSNIHYVSGPEIWTKIFKADIIKKNNVKFVEDGLNEDKLFLLNYYYYAKSLFFIDYYGYIWYENGDHLSSHSVKAASLFIDSFYRQFEFVTQHYDDIDINHEFLSSIEGIIGIAVLASRNKEDRLFLIEKLYDFEKYIEFDGSLNRKWAIIVNKFILERKFNIALFLMKIMDAGVTLLKFIKKIKNS